MSTKKDTPKADEGTSVGATAAIVENEPFFQAEDGIRDVERSRGLGDVYKRQMSSSEGLS